MVVALLVLTLAVTSVEVERGTRSLQRMKQHMKAKAQLSIRALETVGLSAEAKDSVEVASLLTSPDVQAAMNSQTPDAVDRLIQGILEGKGSGGVVTTEFNQGGVHATIISNVNELKVTQVDNSKEEQKKALSEAARKKEIRDSHAQADEEIKKKEARHAKLMGEESEESSEESSGSEGSEASISLSS